MSTNNARDNLKKRDYFERFGIAEGLRRLAADYPFQPRPVAGANIANRKGAAACAPNNGSNQDRLLYFVYSYLRI
jgi:hypothetical protein